MNRKREKDLAEGGLTWDLIAAKWIFMNKTGIRVRSFLNPSDDGILVIE